MECEILFSWPWILPHDLGTQLDTDIIKTFMCTENDISISKVIAWTETQTHWQTDKHTHTHRRAKRLKLLN